jgi:DNA-binding response OmpR family regulator
MKHINLMIIDDEQRYADMLAKRLALRGLICTVRYDGESALKTLDEERFPVVLLDLQLPDLYGTEVLQRLKEQRPETVVLILTGHGTEKDRKACMALGAHAFLNKPLSIDRLMDILADIRGLPE